MTAALDRQLMQQALDALKLSGYLICGRAHHAKKDRHGWGMPCPIEERHAKAIKALRARLATKLAPGAMCSKIIVGLKYCGFAGDCEHKSCADMIAEKVIKDAPQGQERKA